MPGARWRPGTILADFASDTAGNFVPAFLAFFTALAIGAAFALNVADISKRRSNYQQALDAAVLAAASSSTLTDNERIKIATDYFASNDHDECVETSSSFAIESDKVTGQFYCRHVTIFSNIVNPPMVDMTVTSAAVIKKIGKPLCIFAMNETAKSSYLESGGGEVKGNDCTAQINSASTEAVTLSGGSKLTSAENCIVGGVKQGYSMISPAPPASCAVKSDPFAAVPKPTVGLCNYNNFSSNVDGTVLSPGVYCGGLTLQNKSFTLKPGLYILKDGGLNSSGGAQISGTGVSFYITGTNAGVNLSGGGSYKFTATKAGAMAGFVIYIDPGATKTSKSVVSGGGDTFYEGAFYFPGQLLEMSGGSTTATPSPFTAFVADKMLFSGSSDLMIGVDPSKATVPIPAGFYSGQGQPRLVQ